VYEPDPTCTDACICDSPAKATQIICQ
jgi:hypothetical protein